MNSLLFSENEAIYTLALATRSTPPKEFPWSLYYCDLYFDYGEILGFLRRWSEVPEFSELLEALKPVEERELERAVFRCLWLKSYFDRLREILAVSPEESGGSRIVMQRVCDLLNEISPLVDEEPLLSAKGFIYYFGFTLKRRYIKN